MANIGSVGTGIPEYHLSQDNVKELVAKIFQISDHSKLKRILPVFDHAQISSRQFAADEAWYDKDHSIKEKNDLYIKQAVSLSLKAIDNCLHADEFLCRQIDYAEIDFIIFVSSTGIATPSIDAYIINERPFREDIIRMPLWGLGCAGGAMALSHAANWLKANPDKIGLVVCCELCSLTFQKNDYSIRNIVGTAIFADGVGAVLLVGTESKHNQTITNNKMEIKATSSWLKKESLDLMGWNMNNNGFEVVFSKRIPTLIKKWWRDHLHFFLERENVDLEKLNCLVAHPGGRKVLEEMEQVLNKRTELLDFSYDVLNNHGNMSSATVLYILQKYLRKGIVNGYNDEKAVLCALGPGFSSEMMLLEWQG